MRTVLQSILFLVLTSALYPFEWRKADDTFQWSFPRDHWAHPEFRTEWWYFTGHLRTAGETEYRFGYQFTFFRVGLAPKTAFSEGGWRQGQIVMGHAAVSDLVGQTHRFSEVLYRETPFLGGFSSFPHERIAWSLGPPGTAGSWTLNWNGQAFDFSMQDSRRQLALDLSTKPLKPLVFQGRDGLSRKSSITSASSLYYSFTRLQTAGTVRVGESTLDVEGESWMDKEISSDALSQDQTGWDWFSLQLKDGRELMLYSLRDRAGEIDFGSGTVIDANGQTRYLSLSQWSAEPTKTWFSNLSQAEYPVAWTLDIPSESLHLTVIALMPDQENRSQLVKGLTYWEGAVIVSEQNRPIGRGYVELTGYAAGSRLPL